MAFTLLSFHINYALVINGHHQTTLSNLTFFGDSDTYRHNFEAGGGGGANAPQISFPPKSSFFLATELKRGK